ncbi:MAG: hypothetical protein JNK74_05620 [Candidatus Hydrogenedentes bacterium]|nr:hypothetical protein [Candidatus Hydrogenedentota bacterium]
MKSIQINDLDKNVEVTEPEQVQIVGGLLPALVAVETTVSKDHKNWINVASCNMGGHK